MFSIIQAAGWPIWPLLACSVLALAVVIERFLSLRMEQVAPPKLVGEAMLVSRLAVPSQEIIAQLEAIQCWAGCWRAACKRSVKIPD